ncbi:hypothetical protein EYF80_006932 [Liparis tanakae]|uniref:Uncharacterized protein n=1 Tax=Liparis tanakae TaxID=230148 RepID=A0A4Z2IYB9_9TELE|nr:hypothetical protein EYF80_006932 [Liparis tanakae]
MKNTSPDDDRYLQTTGKEHRGPGHATNDCKLSVTYYRRGLQTPRDAVQSHTELTHTPYKGLRCSQAPGEQIATEAGAVM